MCCFGSTHLAQRWAVRLLLAGLLAGLLAACATTPGTSTIPATNLATSKPPAPRILALEPSVLKQGRAAKVDVQVEQWTPDTQLVLMPAGPYVTHRLPLASPPRALASDGSRAFVASTDGRLLMVDFPPQSERARLLSQLSLAAPATQLHIVDQRLLALLADGGLQWLDISQPTTPRIVATLPAPGTVRDVQLDSKAAWLLLDARGQSQLQRWTLVNDQPQLERQWSLPLPARAFAVRGQQLWLVGQHGIALLDISGEQAQLRDVQPTSGSADDVQLQDQLALVADGRGGLVAFGISTPGRVQWRGSFNKRGGINGFAASASDALLSLQNGSLLRLGLANPELPSSGAAFRADAALVASSLSGDVAVLATEQGLQRVMMVGGGDGAISPEGLNLGGSRRGTIRGDVLYVADWFSGLHLYDISNPRQLRHLGNYHTPGSSKGVTLLGDYALVGDDDQGLQIINIADPHQPRWTAELPPAAMAGLGLAYTMKLVGTTLYLADHRGGFHIIDLSDIKHPRRLGGYDTPGKAWDIDVHDGVAFVADDRGGLLMFDVRNPASPEPFAQFNPGGQAEAVALQDGRAYVAFFDKGLYVLDVENPRAAKVLGHTPIPGNARGLELGDGLVYVASWEAGLQIVDVRDASAPRIIGRFDTDGAAWGVNVKGDYAYVLDWWGGIKVVDVSEPTRPRYVSRYHARGKLQQLRTKDTYLYAASGRAGLQVYDIKNPLNPIWLRGVDIGGESRDLWLEDDRAYLAAADSGVFIFDTLDPFYTQQIGHIDTPGEAIKLVAGNEYLYIVDSQAGLLVMDVREPQQPVEVARYALSVRDLWLDDEQLWLVTATSLSGWSLADDGRLSETVNLPGAFTAVRAQHGLLVASKLSGGIKLWQQNEQGWLAVGEYVSGDMISDLQLSGERLYVLGPRAGLQTVDIHSLQQPRLATLYPPTGQHDKLVIARGAAFLAGEKKLASLTLLPTLTVKMKNANELGLYIPAALPQGEYHLLAVGPQGQRQLLPNALKLQFAAPGKKSLGLGALRRLLKTPLKPPMESQTELPSGLPSAEDTKRPSP